MDRENIETKKLVGFHSLLTYDSFNFKRTFEYIKDFVMDNFEQLA